MSEREGRQGVTTASIGADLLESVEQMQRGARGRVHGEVALIRYRTGLSQSQFAALLGVSVRTLQDWEQGRRRPRGAARTLLRIAERHPELLKELAA